MNTTIHRVGGGACALEEFATRHGLQMEVNERSRKDLGDDWPHGRFYASFKDAEIKDGCVLISTFGNGTTPEEAIAEYAKRILGQRLVIDAGCRNRREIDAPNEWRDA